MTMHVEIPYGDEPEQVVMQHDQIHIPRPIAYMMGALMLFTLVSITVARHENVGVTHEDPLVATQSVAFRFSSPAMDAIVATRDDGTRVELAKRNEEIFPRLILRSIANIRMRDGVDQRRPIELAVTADGQRLLVDRATHRTVRLAAFGPQNGHSFDALLPDTQS